jgi:transposase
MRTGISITLKPADRRRLAALARDRNTPHKHVWRAQIVLLSADGVGTNEIMRQTGKSKTCVWRWQERFTQEGYGGLLRDKTRPSRIPPLGPDIAERVVMLTQTEPPTETTHWTAVLMAKAVGISASSVQRIWRAHGLQPDRVRQFKLSKDPKFIDKLRDVVGLYVDPPAHAIVLSVDEKSQIQALDRTQPGLPMKRGRAGTMTHDYKRHGTTTLFAALDVLEGKVIGRCMQRHRHQEFIRFLNAIEAQVPARKTVHVVLDNYAAHKHPKVFSNSGSGCQALPIILAGPTVLSAVGAGPPHDGVRRRWWINVASAVSLAESSHTIGRSHHRHRPGRDVFSRRAAGRRDLVMLVRRRPPCSTS